MNIFQDIEKLSSRELDKLTAQILGWMPKLHRFPYVGWTEYWVALADPYGNMDSRRWVEGDDLDHAYFVCPRWSSDFNLAMQLLEIWNIEAHYEGESQLWVVRLGDDLEVTHSSLPYALVVLWHKTLY